MADSFLKSFAAELATASMTWGAIAPFGLSLSWDQKKAATETGVKQEVDFTTQCKIDRSGCSTEKVESKSNKTLLYPIVYFTKSRLVSEKNFSV